MWIKNFINECRAWHIVRREYKKNKNEFLKLNIKCDWFGKLGVVINRDPSVDLGSEDDELLLHNETAQIWQLLVKHGIADILAYELIPLEEETQIDENTIEFEHGYRIILTPAWNLDKQYVTVKSVLTLFFTLVTLGVGIWHSLVFWIL